MNPRLTRLDRIIGYFAPKTMVQRAIHRRQAAVLEQHFARHFEGAGRGRRTQGWKTSKGSANAVLESSLPVLRDRSRDLRRNNVYANRAINIVASNTIGTGIVASIKPRGTTTTEQLLETKDLWSDWAETTLIDADGRLDFYGLQNLIMQTVVESGECLIRRRWRRPDDPLPVPLQLQVLEPDFIDSLKNGVQSNGNRIVQGIEFSPTGKRVAYWLFEEHPGNSRFTSMSSKRIQARDILHVYRMERAGQVRGLPWLSPAIIRLREFDEYQDATLVRQKLSACYTAFITETEPPADGLPNNEGSALPEKLEPGLIQGLQLGQSVEFANPPQLNDSEFSKNTLRGISVGTGVTYEQLTGDLSNVNFSSGRMGLLEFYRQVEQWRWFLVVPQVCDPVYAWFQEAALLKGLKVPRSRVKWTPPKREYIDPVSETNAAIAQIRGGLMTLPEAVSERGGDFDLHVQEIADSNAKLDDLNITLDTDPRRMSKVGFAQAGDALEMLSGLTKPNKETKAE